MTKAEFKELVENGPVILDGATGTNLQKAGMPVGVCPEQWILENPDIQGKTILVDADLFDGYSVTVKA